MIYLVLPLGAAHGWGVCGRYLAREMSALTDVRLITEPFTLATVGDELEYDHLHRLTPSAVEKAALASAKGHVEAPVLAAITGSDMRPLTLSVRGKFNAGYTFFEENNLSAASLANARRFFDVIATGSNWNTELLKAHGLKSVVTVVQGVDPALFNATHNEKEFLHDKFVIFSGGKLEFRKGQDLVIRAFKAMQQKYKDVVLVNFWSNPFEFSLATMSASRYIKFDPTPTDHAALVQKMMIDNGVYPKGVYTLPPRFSSMMPRVYKNSDVGLFPNRCEGGTNLMLMEYMACGKPVIASYTTGQKDILSDENALLVKTMRPVKMRLGVDKVVEWDDPSLDEIIAQLEYAYHHREKIKHIGHKAGVDMKEFTWKATAEKFMGIMREK